MFQNEKMQVQYAQKFIFLGHFSNFSKLHKVHLLSFAFLWIFTSCLFQ